MPSFRIRVEQFVCFFSVRVTITAVLLLGTLAKPACSAEGLSDGPPNIVLIMADDLGFAELGCYGQKKIETPNIDQLAAEGMRFTQFYAGSPVCAPARCTLMTGKHAGHAHVRGNLSVSAWDIHDGQTPIPADTATLPAMLKQAGYVTGAFGKWGLGPVGSSGDPLNHGFDRFFGYNCQKHAHNLYPKYLIDNDKQRRLEGNTRSTTGKKYAPQEIADEALKFLRKNHDKPFFLYYPAVLPHLALQAPDEEIAHYRGRWAETPYNAGPEAQHPYLPHPTPRACYASMITFHDKQVGRIMALLKELGVDDNTIVLYTSDNGTTYIKEQVDYEFFESVGDLRGLKAEVYEGGVRVPMIARWPNRIQQGTSSDHLSAHYDMLATIADVAQIADHPHSSIPETDGISLLPSLLSQGDAAQKKHEYLFWDFAGYGGQTAIRRGDWKGVKQNLQENPNAPLELYNLQQDPNESHDLAKENPQVVAELEKLMLEVRERPVLKEFRFGQYAH